MVRALASHQCGPGSISYGGPQLSHQNQMLTANYKALTSNSNRSHQIQIAHSKFKSLTANYKSLTANSNRSQQIKVAHSKFKSFTSNSNRSQQIQITHSKLQIAHSKFKSPTANSSRSQQIKVAHSKFKLLTSNYKLDAKRLWLSTASGTTRLNLFVIHESATL